MSIIKTVEGVAYSLISVPAEPGRGRHEIDHLTVGRLSTRAGHSDPYTADRRLQELGSDPEQPIPFKNPSPRGLLDSFSVPFELSLFFPRRALRRDRTVLPRPCVSPDRGAAFRRSRLNAIFGRRRWGLSGAGSAHGCVFYPYCLRAIHFSSARLDYMPLTYSASCFAEGFPRHSVGQGLATSPGGDSRC